MRYNDWDVLLFPTGPDSKTPFKEFRVTCHVIPDVELAHCQGSMGIPIVTCFVPSLPPGAPFQVSVHSWSEPNVSQFTKNYSKHIELVQFEARIFIDGHLAASSVFDRKEEWPHLINTTLEMTKSGDLAPLKFPAFKKGLLYPHDWNAGDGIGRIKVVISEGFPSDSLTSPIERVKNIVAFSFKHAPLDVLEANDIAWPNASMWRIPGVVNSSLPVPTYHRNEGPLSHAHSPRRSSMLGKSQAAFQGFQGFPGSSMVMGPAQPQPNAFFGNMGFPAGPPVVPRNPNGGIATDSLDNMAYFDWINSLTGPFTSGFAGKSMWPVTGLNRVDTASSDNNDLMQTDFRSQSTNIQTYGGEPMHISGASLEDEPLPTTSVQTNAPTNTPSAGSNFDSNNINTTLASFHANSNSFITPDFAHSLNNSLLNQPLPIQPQNIPLPASEIKSRKERDTRFLTLHGSNPASASSTPQGAGQHDIRKFSQPIFNAVHHHHQQQQAPPPPNIYSTAAAASTTATSPQPSALFPASGTATSRNSSSTGDVGAPNLASLGGGGGATPLPLHNSSAASLNAGPGGSSGRKRGRNFTPASSKAIDDEDQPLRPSPHMRASFGMGGDEEE